MQCAVILGPTFTACALWIDHFSKTDLCKKVSGYKKENVFKALIRILLLVLMYFTFVVNCVC